MTQREKRQAILMAAENLFKDRRFHQVTLDEVAAAARVGKGTIYLYFKNKEDLFLQMIMDGFRTLEGALREIAAKDGSVKDKLCGVGKAMSEEFERHHALFMVLFSQEFMQKQPGAKALVHEHMTSLHQTIERIFREGVEAGALRKDLDVANASCIFTGSIHERNHRQRHTKTEIALEPYVDLVLHGCLPRR